MAKKETLKKVKKNISLRLPEDLRGAIEDEVSGLEKTSKCKVGISAVITKRLRLAYNL